MGTEAHRKLTFLFFPFMAQGHVIPTLDMAKLFASRGASVSILTTPLNVPLFEKQIQRAKDSGLGISIRVTKFPAVEAGLPENCENMDSVTETFGDSPMEMILRFFAAMRMLKDGLEKVLEETKPDCLVADMFFPWGRESADKFGTRTLVFHGTSCFSQCVTDCVRLYEPHKKVSSDFEPFVVPNLPGNIALTKNKLGGGASTDDKEENELSRVFKELADCEKNSFGVLFNSFYELEPAYAEFYRKELKRRSWHVGPVSLHNRGIEEKAGRGKNSDIDEHECLRWLDSKKPNSVVYVCFGSVANFSASQLLEIAKGLEASDQHFIWVVRKKNKNEENGKEDWLPEGFEERTKERGLIIRGWAPQVLILDHQATGGFVTHCGWNSTLEGISAGLPMVAWPVSAEQFYNEILVTKVLDIGVSVGVQKRVMLSGDFISSDRIETAVREIMVGEKAEERRSRAKRLADLARSAVEEGGSSYSELEDLFRQLRSVRRSSQEGGQA